MHIWHRFIDALQDDALCCDELAIGDVVKNDEHADGILLMRQIPWRRLFVNSCLLHEIWCADEYTANIACC